MKENISRMWRSGIAMLLALCLVVGVFPVAAFATEAEETLYYVSLGDSTTNGYGLTGYELEVDGLLDWVKTNYPDYDSETTVENPNGLLMETPGAYPAKFREYLEEKTGREVNLIQLAISAMRADDVLQLLTYGTDDYYKLDDYSGNKDNAKYVIHNKFLDDHNLPFEWSYDLNDTLGSMADLYQNSIKAADVVSINLGSNNFSIYLWSFLGPMLTEIMAGNVPTVNGIPTLDELVESVDPSLVPVVNSVYAKVKAMMMSKLAPMLPSEDLADSCAAIADCAAFTFLSYCVSYTRILDRINELNKDTDIILMPMVNFMKGFTIDLDNGQTIDMSDYIAYMLDAANTYVSGMAAVKTENTGLSNKVFYADHGGKVDMLMAEMPILAENNFEGAEVLHSRLITSLTGWIHDLSGGAFNLNAVRKITREDVQNYKNEALVINSVDAGTHAANVGAYVGIETALINAAQNDAIKAEFFMDILSGNLMADMTDLFTNVGNIVGTAASEQKFYEIGDAVASLMDTNETAQGLLYFMAYFMVADGVVCHPSESGYTTIFNAMKKAYDENITVKDETLDNLETALDAVAEFVKKYAPEAGAAVWERWEQMGYVDEVETYIDQLIKTVKERYNYYANEAVPAIDAAIVALEGEKDVLVAELDELNAQLAKKKAELEAVINGIEIGSIHMPEINIDALGGNAQTEVPDYECEVDGEGVVAELEAAIRDLEHAIAVVEALIADVEADLADMAKLAAQIADAVKELNKTYESIVAAAEDLYDAFKAIEEVLTNDADQSIEAVTSAYEAARSTALAAVDVLEVAMAYARELDADILAEVDNIVALAESLYDTFITEDSLKAYVKVIVNRIQPQLTEKEQMAVGITAMILKELAPEVIDYAENELPGKIDALEEKCRAEIDALIEEYGPQIEQAKKDLADKWESEIKPQIDAKYAEVKAEIETEYDAAVAALEAKRTELMAELVAAEAELKAAMEAMQGEAEDKIEAAVAPLKAQIARLEKDIATVAYDLAHAATHLENALIAAYKEIEIAVMALYNEAMAQLNKAIEELKAQLEKAIEDLNKALMDMIEEALGELLDEIKKTVEELKNALIAMGIETIEELVDALVNLFNELLYKATHATLVIDNDFKYVALGDGSAAAEGYAEELKAYLSAEAAAKGVPSIDFVNAAFSGNSVAAEAANLSAEAADADLITLGFSQTDMLASAITAGELDWAALVGAEAVPYVEEALAKVEAEINALEVNDEIKNMLNAVVEAYAYNAVEYAINLPALIREIREVNAEAVVIVVGMYNPIESVTVNVLGKTVELAEFAEYFDYIVEAVDVYGIGLAMLSNAMDYVAAPEVEIEKAELGIGDLGTLLEGDLSAMYPNANGDAYIAEKIEDALTLIVVAGGLWGDANGDGQVRANDAQLVLQYSVGLIGEEDLNLAVCDVNGDGEILANDAQLILQHSVGLITKFPVEG